MAKIVDFKNNLRQQLKYLSTGHALIRLKYDSLSRLYTLPLSLPLPALVNGYGNSHMQRVRENDCKSHRSLQFAKCNCNAIHSLRRMGE